MNPDTRRLRAAAILFAIEATVMRSVGKDTSECPVLTELVDEARALGADTIEELRTPAHGSGKT